jgi:hypothetical protein
MAGPRRLARRLRRTNTMRRCGMRWNVTLANIGLVVASATAILGAARTVLAYGDTTCSGSSNPHSSDFGCTWTQAGCNVTCPGPNPPPCDAVSWVVSGYTHLACKCDGVLTGTCSLDFGWKQNGPGESASYDPNPLTCTKLSCSSTCHPHFIWSGANFDAYCDCSP